MQKLPRYFDQGVQNFNLEGHELSEDIDSAIISRKFNASFQGVNSDCPLFSPSLEVKFENFFLMVLLVPFALEIIQMMIKTDLRAEK